ncbi:MAG: translocation/assembly module TamB domain-containing protein [Bacteroidaceae bacterium]|nr:translocation/assembly module TamB domain-containing protein [Bacteroidaceae bacterium]
MKRYGKYTLLGWSWRILLWIVLTPIFLLLLLFVLIYLPPVQKFAVDKAAEVLSEEMGMEVTVESVHLKFPLDLSMGGIVAIEEGDTVLAARELDISVKALPLLDLQAEVDGIHLYDAKLNTKGMIDACVIKGNLAELSLNSHSTDIKNGLAVVNEALLREADLAVLMNDSVPEDTTTVDWRVQLDDLTLQQVKLNILLTPNADSTWVGADIGQANTKAYLDLKEGAYRVDWLDLQDSKIAYTLQKERPKPEQLDPNHLLFDVAHLRLDSLSYVGDDFSVRLTELAATEQSGLTIAEMQGRVEMDSLSLTVPKLHLKTDESDLTVAYRMDLNAFDDENPGKFSLLGEGQIGKGDVIYFTRMGGADTKETCAMLNKELPARPIELQLKADGNLETLEVSELHLKVPGKLLADGSATLWNVADDLSLKTRLKAKDANGASVDLEGGYVMASDAYRVNGSFNNVVLNHYVPLEESCVVTGKVDATGRGFDVFSPATTLDATAHLSNGYYGKINLSNIDTNATLKGQKLLLDMMADNDQLQTSFNFDGTLKKNLVEGVLNLDLPFADVQKMGFSDDILLVSTNGSMNFSYNLDKIFKVESDITSLHLNLGGDSIITHEFSLYAEALKDTTLATLRTGDLNAVFFTPNNMFNLNPQLVRFQKEAFRQFKQHDVDLDALKAYLPALSLHATAGQDNPLLSVLNTYGIHFNEFSADVESSPERGLVGYGHVYGFKKDSLRVDTAFFEVEQGESQLEYYAGVQCKDQPLLPAFRAYLDGHVKANEVDAHLTYFDKKNRQGIDLGVKGLANDTCVNYSLYPQQPIIGFRKFSINPDNYIVTHPNRPIMADVRLTGLADSCYVAVYADEGATGKQIANVIVNDLKLGELLKVLPIPGLPTMDGMLHLDATYIDQGDNFLVEGEVDAQQFSYEGQQMGDLSSNFTYMPKGDTEHDINAELAINDQKILQLEGMYDAEGEGEVNADLSFMDVPMEMFSPFIPGQIVGFDGHLGGNIKVTGPTSALIFNGALLPQDVHLLSVPYNFNLAMANDSIVFNNSRVDFNDFKFYGADKNPLTLNGYVDFANLDEIFMSLSLNGRNVKVIEAKQTRRSLLYGDMYGDFFARVIGSTKDLTIRGLVRVLPTTNITYVLSETALYQSDRLEDIVTFVDSSAPPASEEFIPRKSFTGIDMNLTLSIEDGAKLNGEFSADKQSYVNVQGGGSVTMTYTPEGAINMQGRYTINEGEMKYTLPVIPLKTFTIHKGSYIEFVGEPTNPTLNIAATERVRAAVGDGDGASRTVLFETGLKITNSLNDMGLEFTIEAPEDLAVQNELAGYSVEDKNKLAIGMLATGMYLSGSNRKGFTAGNALNAFLQNEINNIAGKAMSTMVNVDVGMEKMTRDDGTTRTDYSFKFSRKFFSDRLNVVIGGKVSSDGDKTRHESGAYIDDVSLEWRLDNGGSQYVRLFHQRDFSNLIEGQIDMNGAGILLRRKVDKLSDLLIWRKQEEEKMPERARRSMTDAKEEQSDTNTEKKEE